MPTPPKPETQWVCLTVHTTWSTRPAMAISSLSPGKEGGDHLPLPAAQVGAPARGSPGPLTWAPTAGPVRCRGVRLPVGLGRFPEPCVVAAYVNQSHMPLQAPELQQLLTPPRKPCI